MNRSTAIALLATKAVLGASIAIGFASSPAAPAHVAAADALPACQYEDGNTDGSECLWRDPDTGREFYVESSNYREDDGYEQQGDLTYCPRDGVWSRKWHWRADGPDPRAEWPAV